MSESIPDPQEIYAQAHAERDVIDLDGYIDSIELLRQKGFSFREISEWMQQKGIPCDHNAVYRAQKRHWHKNGGVELKFKKGKGRGQGRDDGSL